MAGDNDELPQDVVEELLGVPEASLPTSDLMNMLSARATELMHIEVRISQIKAEEQELLDRRQELSTRVLPEIMDQAMVDRIGIPGMLSDVILEPHFHANIKSEWPDDKRNLAFAKLEELGGGSMIRTTVEVSFQRGEYELAKDLVSHIQRWNGLQGREVRMNSSVPWNSLTAFIKDAFESGRKALPLEELGARISRRCRVIARTSKKVRR